MITKTSDLIEKLNVTKTLYSKYDKDLVNQISKQALDDELKQVYNQGNNVLMGFIFLHFILALFIAYVYQNVWTITLTVGIITCVVFYSCAIFYPTRFATRALAGVCLQVFVVLYLYQTKGVESIQFFFFTSFVIMIVYQDWKAIIPAAIIFIGQLLLLVYASSTFNYLLINEEYKQLLDNLIPKQDNGKVNQTALWFYLGVSVLQVSLAGIWAGFLKLNTIKEVKSHQELEIEKNLVNKSNEELELKIEEKTKDLQKSLEETQANEEELRQNMEELQATQEEIENQRKQLLSNQEKMQVVEQELRERQAKMEYSQWLESNLSRFDDLMRLNYDKGLETFAEAIMIELAELLDALQGAFYVYDEDSDTIQMQGGYACTKETVKQATFRTGEGMLGQIVKSKKTLHLDNLVGEGAIIESALTKVISKSLIIVPLLYNEAIQGVLEVAMLEDVEDKHLEFLERLAKNIASMLQSMRGIHRTRKLLNQSQEATAKFQENAKELERTKQEVERKALEFQSQFKAIDRSMLVIEYTPKGKITHVNDNFLKLSKYSRKELLGKHQSIFLKDEFVNSKKYADIWNSIVKGEHQEAEYECIAKDGSSFWIKSNYYSLGEGQNKKIMILGYDTTKEKAQDNKILKSLKSLKEKDKQAQQHIKLMQKLQKEVEDKARDYQEQLNAINTASALVEYDTEGKIQYTNDIFLEMTGYNSKDLLNKSHKALVRERFAKSKAYQKFWERLQNNEFIDGEFEILAQNGELLWLRGSYYPVSDKEGNLIKVIQLANNISNEKKQEEQIKQYLINLEKTQASLKTKTSELSAQLNAINQSAAMIEMTPDGEITRTNEKFAQAIGYKPKELIGQNHNILVTTQIAKSNPYKTFWEDLNKGEFIEGEFARISKTKKEYKARVSYFPVLDNRNEVVKIIGIVSEIKQTQNINGEKTLTNSN